MTGTTSGNVFINCPFDEDYAALRSAILFAVVDCGFTPRCALENSDASEIRIQNIYRIIDECALGKRWLRLSEQFPANDKWSPAGFLSLRGIARWA